MHSMKKSCVLCTVCCFFAILPLTAGFGAVRSTVHSSPHHRLILSSQRLSRLKCITTATTMQQQQQQPPLIDLQALKQVAEQAMLDVSEDQLRQMLPLVNRRLQYATQLHDEAQAMGVSEGEHEYAKHQSIPLEALPPDQAVPYANVARIVANFPEVHAGYLKVPSTFPRRRDASTPVQPAVPPGDTKKKEQQPTATVQQHSALKRAWRWFRGLLGR